MITIRSGGQTGVDRAALDFAIGQGRPYAGWCPAGGWAEDFPHPPGLIAAYPRLLATPSADPRQRTEWNVRDSAATLILTRRPVASEGTSLTARSACALGRPVLVVDLDGPVELRPWLARRGADFVLNIAGPRESEAPGIYAEALRFLDRWLAETC